jgi:hypothetical protein
MPPPVLVASPAAPLGTATTAPWDSAPPAAPTPSLTLPETTTRCEFEAPGTLVVTRGDRTRELWSVGQNETLVRREVGRAPDSTDPEASEPPIILEPEGPVGMTYRFAAVGIRDLASERRARLLPWARSMGLEVTEGERIWIRDTETVNFVISADLRLAVVLDRPRDLGRATGLLLDTGRTWTVHAWHSTLSRNKTLQSRFLPQPTPSAEHVLLTNLYPIGRDVGRRTRIVTGDSGRAVAEIIPPEAALSRHGNFVTATDLDWALRVYDAADGRLRFMVPEAPYLEPVWWSEDDRALAVACRIYASSTGAPIFRPAETPVERRDVSFTADGRTLVELRADGLVAWDLQRSERVRLLDDVVPEPSRIVFDAAERRVAVVSARGVTVVDLLPEPRLVATLAAPWREDRTSAFPSSPMAAAFALNDAGTELAVAKGDRLLVYALPPPGSQPVDATTAPAMSVMLPGHALAAAAAWSSDGAWLAIARRREPEVPYGLLQVTLVSRGAGLRVVRSLSLGRSDVDHLSVGIAFRPGTSTVAMAYLAEDDRLALYEARTGRRVALRSERQLGDATDLGWSRDGSTLFVNGIADGVLAVAPDLAPLASTTGPVMRGVREAARHGLAPAGSSSRRQCIPAPSGTPIAVCWDGTDLWLQRPNGAQLSLADYRLEGREGALVLDAEGHWDGPPEAAGWLVWRWPDPPNRPPPTPAELLAAQRPKLLRTFVEGASCEIPATPPKAH